MAHTTCDGPNRASGDDILSLLPTYATRDRWNAAGVPSTGAASGLASFRFWSSEYGQEKVKASGREQV